MSKNADKTLSDAILHTQALTSVGLQEALRVVSTSGESLDSYLIRNGLLSKAQILDALAHTYNIETIDLKRTAIDPSVLDRVPVKFAWYYKFMPVRIENKALTLAVAFPLDVKVQDEIRVHLGYEPRVALASETDVLDALKKYYGLAAEMIDRILTKEPVKRDDASDISAKWVEDLEQKTDDASVGKLVNQIILEAYKKRASDIHIEPYRGKVRFRYRIDGVLVDANLPSDIKHFIAAIISRIKIMSNLSIVEKRLPQDGSAVVKVQDQILDLRVSTIPTPQGESLVLRILPTKVMRFKLEELGLDNDNLTVFQQLIQKPHGVIFVTGPTGSGKTTTLYACLHEVNSTERKIITIEDPVEYEMENITQIQVNPKVGLTFAAGLRSVLRHDPDIIMVGEVRDLETAEIAIRTALTGHLVFSTLHTNDAASGVTRLIEMNVEPYLVSSSIEAFIAQRLVRTICHGCKRDVECPPEIQKEIIDDMGLTGVQAIKVYAGKGCDRCNQTGYYGRTAIYEVLLMSDAIRAAILEKPRADYIRQMAIKQGMRTLRQDGWLKALSGVTTYQEVMNATSREEKDLSGSRVVSPSAGSSGATGASDLELIHSKGRYYRIVSRDELSDQGKEAEARAYPRLNEKFDIRFRLFRSDPNALALQAEEVEVSTCTKNIGAGGILFVSYYPFPIGSILEVKVVIDKERRQTVECLAKISRVERDEETGSYNIVAYFLDISSADRAKIDTLVRTRSSRNA